MSITAYKVEAVGHDRTGKDFGYVNIMYRYGNKQSCPRPDQCEKIEVMWADESVYGPPVNRVRAGPSGCRSERLIWCISTPTTILTQENLLLPKPTFSPLQGWTPGA